MNNYIFKFPEPKNEPILSYAPQSPERETLVAELNRQATQKIEIPLIIDGKEVRTGKMQKVVMPHKHSHVLATYHIAGAKEINMAIDAALRAKQEWMTISWVERASIMLKAAELMAQKYRPMMNASTMLGQSKNVYQAEIDAACESIDFLRFNAHFASQIYTNQPLSAPGYLDRVEYRPLEGFILAITPFNFTAIAVNLTTSVALMGNTVVWKPGSTSILSNYYFMKILQEAGLPDGVINFVPAPGALISDLVMKHRELAGLHFTGSTEVFNQLWKTVGDNLSNYRSYPKLVGETGGKDFIFVHRSSDPAEVATAIVRGAFEYQGQKCSAASRAYIPQSLWENVKARLLESTRAIKVGDVRDFTNFVNAVIDDKSYNNIMSYIEMAKNSPEAEIITGGKGNKSEGYFIEPTIIVTKNPHFKTMEEEIFGPVMSIYVYPDEQYEKTLQICDQTSPYALTGSIFTKDKYAMIAACRALRYACGNFYINDKPTGAVVGQQPFGGSRASGTNDKAGSYLNLVRWVNPRTIKETFCPPADFRYPFMEP